MTRALAISQRQTQSLIRAAEAEQAIVEVKIGDAVFRLIPKCHTALAATAIDETSSPASFSSIEDYRIWRNRTRVDRD